MARFSALLARVGSAIFGWHARRFVAPRAGAVTFMGDH
jgi:hypothetical protein